MFSKLALRNVRRSFRDYGVYLLTLTFGVCLFYTFNSIDGQGVMVYLAQSQNPMAQLIQTILDIFSVFVAVVLACLILYANTFLIRRRKRELGTYLLLGLSQRQVSGLLVLETLVIGLISLAAGLLLGLAASQGLSALTLSMFSIRVDAFALAFSPRAAVRTVGYFGLIFLLVMVFSGIQVSRARLIDLMQGSGKMRSCGRGPGAGGGPVRAGGGLPGGRLCHPADLWHGHRCGGPAHLCGHAVPGHPGHSADL